MEGFSLKLSLISIVALLFSSDVPAQDFRFIYMQTEDQTPFYIRNGSQTLSSATSGYVIIPRLAPGSYNITIGLPKKNHSEFSVWVDVSQTDAGYIIKDDSGSGCYLVNLQSMEPVAIERKQPANYDLQLQKRNDVFARILAEVVNDSSVIEINAFQRDGMLAVNGISTKTPGFSKNNQQLAVNNKNEPVENKNKAVILKLGQSFTNDGLLFSYLDGKDTIKVFLPVEKPAAIKGDNGDKRTLAAYNVNADTLRNILSADSAVQKKEQLPDSVSIKKEDTLNIEPQTALQKNDKLFITAEQCEGPVFSIGGLAGNGIAIGFAIEKQVRWFHVPANVYAYDPVNDGMPGGKQGGSYFGNQFKAILIH